MTENAPGAPPILTFLVPIRHPATVSDWSAVKARLAETLASLAAQTTGNWKIVLVANDEADLPELPAKTEVVRVHLAPPEPLPKCHSDEQLYEHIRGDKGRRVLLGLLQTRPQGFVMTVDYDDFVSRRLAELISKSPGANGWYVDDGYLYDSGSVVLRWPQRFHEFCGTSILVRADLLGLPASEAEASELYIRHSMGSHKFMKNELAAQGKALERVPFPGAMYRIGYRGAATGSKGIFQSYFRRWMLRKEPLATVRRLFRLRRLSAELLDEFFGGNRGQRAG
jgi:hypothetical protein